jgi:hypothetical protein
MFHSQGAKRAVQASAIDGEIGVDYDSWLGDELPSPRADIKAERERTGIRVKGTAGFLKGEIEVISEGSGRSPQARAVTTLIVALAACASTVVVGAVCLLAHAPAAVLGILALTTFAGILAAGLVLAFREKPEAGSWPPPNYNGNGHQRGQRPGRQSTQPHGRHSLRE